MCTFPGTPSREAHHRSSSSSHEKTGGPPPSFLSARSFVILSLGGFLRSSFGENFSRCLDTVERRGKSRVSSHLNHDFDDLQLAASDVERTMDVVTKLRR